MQESSVLDDEGETAAAASVQSVLRKEKAVVKAKTCLTHHREEDARNFRN